MIESPLIDEVVTHITQRDILAFLEARFGAPARRLKKDIQSVTDEGRLADLVRKAATCPDSKAFRAEMRQS